MCARPEEVKLHELSPLHCLHTGTLHWLEHLNVRCHPLTFWLQFSSPYGAITPLCHSQLRHMSKRITSSIPTHLLKWEFSAIEDNAIVLKVHAQTPPPAGESHSQSPGALMTNLNHTSRESSHLPPATG